MNAELLWEGSLETSDLLGVRGLDGFTEPEESA